jgi:hypothetical protein
MYKKFILFSVVGILFIYAAGCATLFKRSSDPVIFSSNEGDTKVFVYGKYVGTVPVKVEMKPNETHVIAFKKKGYKRVYYKLTPDMAAGYIILDIFYRLIIWQG